MRDTTGVRQAANQDLAVATLASPWGPVVVAASAAGVVGVELGGEPVAMRRRLEGRSSASGGSSAPRRSSARGASPGSGGWSVRARAHLDRATHELELAMAGQPSGVAQVPIDWTDLPSFDRRVLEAARQVAWGETATYGELGRRIGAPRAARAVGGAIGRNRFWLLVPCHRIVAAGGRIGGYGGAPYGIELKRELLAREGTVVSLAR